MAIEIVDFPINSMVIFHGKMLVQQRVDFDGVSMEVSWDMNWGFMEV